MSRPPVAVWVVTDIVTSGADVRNAREQRHRVQHVKALQSGVLGMLQPAWNCRTVGDERIIATCNWYQDDEYAEHYLDEIKSQIMAQFDVFAEVRARRGQCPGCACGVCQNLSNIHLRSAVDVDSSDSIVGRLQALKIPSDDFLLVTDGAIDALGELENAAFEPLEGIGQFSMFVTPEPKGTYRGFKWALKNWWALKSGH